MLLNLLQCTGQILTKKNYLAKMWIVQGLKNPDLANIGHRPNLLIRNCFWLHNICFHNNNSVVIRQLFILCSRGGGRGCPSACAPSPKPNNTSWPILDSVFQLFLPSSPISLRRGHFDLVTVNRLPVQNVLWTTLAWGGKETKEWKESPPEFLLGWNPSVPFIITLSTRGCCCEWHT